VRAALKITETLEHFVAKVKRFADQTERGDFDDLTGAEFSGRLMQETRHAKAAIHGISMLLLKSGMTDPDDDGRYTDEVNTLANNAADRFIARRAAKS
jgi:hypothetical protein